MNERIFELAKQADLIQWDILPSGARTPDHESVVKAKKFAELIVKECAYIAEHNVMNISTYADAEFVGEQIKQHFGVE
jgi:hypothetical protein